MALVFELLANSNKEVFVRACEAAMSECAARLSVETLDRGSFSRLVCLHTLQRGRLLYRGCAECAAQPLLPNDVLWLPLFLQSLDLGLCGQGEATGSPFSPVPFWGSLGSPFG
jgi:hypothetical protein